MSALDELYAIDDGLTDPRAGIRTSALIGTGFQYTFEAAAVENARLRVAADSTQISDEWCQLQTPTPWEFPGAVDEYGCLPNVGTSHGFDDGEPTCRLTSTLHTADKPIDCGKLMCRQRCKCDAAACSAVPSGELLFVGALAESGTRLVGTMVLGDERVTVRLERVSARQRAGFALADYAGDWHGFAEAHTFDDGTDRVRLLLDKKGVARVTFGERAAPATLDPDDSYPPVSAQLEYAHLSGGGANDSAVVGPGYPYVLSTTELDVSRRIRLSGSAGEPSEEWCRAQTPSRTRAGDGYDCLGLPAGPTIALDGCTYPQGGLVFPIDCGKLACLFDCSCDAEGCSANPQIESIVLDAVLEEDGRALVGSTRIGPDRFVVRLGR